MSAEDIEKRSTEEMDSFRPQDEQRYYHVISPTGRKLKFYDPTPYLEKIRREAIENEDEEQPEE